MLTEYSEAELNQLIANGYEENIHLDYKSADSLAKTDGKKNEISKDVSAFANSDGGEIVYGVKEFDDLPRRHLPERLDPIDRTVISKEWLEQVIQSKIRPKIGGLIIRPIDIRTVTNGVIYIVEIPKSHTPHQASDKKYYKRFNFESVAMEDYEINDIRGRKQAFKQLISIDYEITSQLMLYLVVKNIGDDSAYDVTFEFPENVKWLRDDEGTPTLFANGVKVFPPGRVYRFLWNFANALFHTKDPNDLRIDAAATYTHGKSGLRVTDEFNIDLEPHRFNSTLKTDVERLSDMLKDKFDKLTAKAGKIENRLAILQRIAGRTGLDFSISTLRNVKALLNVESDLEKIRASDADYRTFMEVLRIEVKLAHKLEHFFRYGVPDSLDDIADLTPEIRAELDRYIEY